MAFHSFALVPAVADIATRMSATRLPFNWAVIQAQIGNTGNVRIVSIDQVTVNAAGAVTVTPTTGGTVLAPNAAPTLPGASLTVPHAGQPLPYDFRNIFLIVDDLNDGVDVSYGS